MKNNIFLPLYSAINPADHDRNSHGFYELLNQALQKSEAEFISQIQFILRREKYTFNAYRLTTTGYIIAFLCEKKCLNTFLLPLIQSTLSAEKISNLSDAFLYATTLLMLPYFVDHDTLNKTLVNLPSLAMPDLLPFLTDTQWKEFLNCGLAVEPRLSDHIKHNIIPHIKSDTSNDDAASIQKHIAALANGNINITLSI